MNYCICKKCCMDTTAEEIHFDERGICNFCRQWGKIEAERLKEKSNLPLIVEQIKKDGKEEKYDVLLGLSGGVDSSYCLHLLVKELGLRPMTYQVDNSWNTEEADENVMRMAENLKVPFYRYVIDVEKFRELQIAFIKSGTANIEIPTDHILFATIYEMADKYGIKWIISGGNHATEGIMPVSWGYNPQDLYFIKSVYKKFTGKKLTGLPMLSLLKWNWYLHRKRIKTLNLLDYFEYNREEAKKILEKEYGWKDYGEKHCESIFTYWFQTFYLPIVFNFDKRKAHYSSLINSKQIRRERAREKLKIHPLKQGFFLPDKESHPDAPFWKDAFRFLPPSLQNIKSYKNYHNSEWLREKVRKFFRKWKLLKARTIL